MDATELKRQAAEYAAGLVRPGMVVGLGGGTTVAFATRRIAQALAAGELHDLLAVPCSIQVEQEARRLAIPLTTLEQQPVVHLAIDGADEVSPDLDLIKGRHGALLREKIVAQATRRELIVVDESKLTPRLGARAPVPVEVVQFGWRSQASYLESLGARVEARRSPDGGAFLSDQGNLIFDCHFGPIADPARLAALLDARAGIVAHGLFVAFALEVIVAGPQGVRHLTRET